MVTSNGSSPLTVRGLDPGMMYSVTINVFDGNQIIFRDVMITANITVKYSSGKISVQATVHTCNSCNMGMSKLPDMYIDMHKI